MTIAGTNGPAEAASYAKNELGAAKKTIPIWFLGVWDTVGALWRGNPNHAKAHQVQLPAAVTRAYHALALDEVRSDFEPVLWTDVAPEKIVEQVWFSGAHSDVGGGYSEQGLSNIALRWMACKAMEAGLALDVEYLRTFVQDENALAHDSHNGRNIVWGKPIRRNLLQTDFKTPSAFWHTVGVHESAMSRRTFQTTKYVGDLLTVPDVDLLKALGESHRRRDDLRRSLRRDKVVNNQCK
jgi:uncharacterized protein (DUF2235 family)